jgi:putative restriction endonuclease
LLVSPRLREDFGNGDQFYPGGEVVELPERRPERGFLGNP